MTIAIGLLAKNGLVVAADRQETIPGYWKHDTGKIAAGGHSIIKPAGGNDSSALPRIVGSAHCLIAGSGHSHQLAAVKAELLKRFNGEPQLETSDQVQPAFTEILEEFHRRYIWPLVPVYGPEDAPSVQIIAGYAYGGGRPVLLESRDHLLIDSGPYVAIGAGADLALTLLGRFYTLPLLDVWQTVLLAAYIIYHVKESIDGCGKRTDIDVLNLEGERIRGGRVHPRTVSVIEDVMEEYSNAVEPRAFRSLVGDCPDEKKGRRRLCKMCEELMAEMADPDRRLTISKDQRPR
jgi:hypothetical protein